MVFKPNEKTITLFLIFLCFLLTMVYKFYQWFTNFIENRPLEIYKIVGKLFSQYVM
jgi:F0F1-type ATP synthase membrane subunit b/b'